jgi:hypothetical protein
MCSPELKPVFTDSENTIATLCFFMINTNPTRSAIVNSDKFPDVYILKIIFKIHENRFHFKIMETFIFCFLHYMECLSKVLN